MEEKISAFETRLAEIRLHLAEEKAGLAQELERLSTLKQGVNESNLQNDYKKERALELEDQLDLCQKELTEVKANAEKIKSEITAINDHLSALARQEAEVTDELQKNRAYLANQEEKNQEIRNRLRGVESKIALLEELEKNHGGYFQGVKALPKPPGPFMRRSIVVELIQANTARKSRSKCLGLSPSKPGYLTTGTPARRLILNDILKESHFLTLNPIESTDA